jgi:hypothetical protein
MVCNPVFIFWGTAGLLMSNIYAKSLDEVTKSAFVFPPDNKL